MTCWPEGCACWVAVGVLPFGCEAYTLDSATCWGAWFWLLLESPCVKLLSSCRGCEVCISALLLNFSLCIMKRSWSPVSAELAEVMCPALSLRLPAIPDPVTVLGPLLNMFIMFA